MGINLGNNQPQASTQAATAATVQTQATTTALVEVPTYSVEAEQKSVYDELRNSPEIQALTSQIEVHNIETITNFGADAAEEISKAADAVLNNVTMPQLNESSERLVSLNKLMGKFEPAELEPPPPPNLFDKILNIFNSSRFKRELDRILKKYDTFGNEIDKIYTQLKKYETEIKQANREQEEIYQANIQFYKKLVKYIVAGEEACKELDQVIADTKAEFDRTGDNETMLLLNSYNNAKDMLDQRVDDLRKAEMVAMQSLPVIKNQQYNNMNLARKINSAFIITLPIFKTNLAQAIHIKRQRMQAEALQALDDTTNKLIMQNAKNFANNSKLIAKQTSGSSIKVETLENSWKEIVNGIQETQRIQEAAKKQRMDDKKRLESLKSEYGKMFEVPGAK